jgi:DNA uptake protein ComE-like DNA-binding protein
MKNHFRSLATLAIAALCVTPAFAAARQDTQSTKMRSTHTSATAATPTAAKLNLNSATETQLAALPGVGDAYAKKIIDGRPYKSKHELVSRRIVPKSVYAKFSHDVVASR